jgi:hypothetical protein
MDESFEWPNGLPRYPDADLVRRAVRNAGRLTASGVRWAAVMETFAVGSSVARALCRQSGLDPYEQVGLVPAPRDEG